jgi:hypothetical protein
MYNYGTFIKYRIKNISIIKYEEDINPPHNLIKKDLN